MGMNARSNPPKCAPISAKAGQTGPPARARYPVSLRVAAKAESMIDRSDAKDTKYLPAKEDHLPLRARLFGRPGSGELGIGGR